MGEGGGEGEAAYSRQAEGVEIFVRALAESQGGEGSVLTATKDRMVVAPADIG